MVATVALFEQVEAYVAVSLSTCGYGVGKQGVPGFELVYRSPESLRGVGGEPSDYFRLYRLR